MTRIETITAKCEGGILKKSDVSEQLRAVDRWASKKKRAIEFLTQNGVRGLITTVREVGIRGTAEFIKRQIRYHMCSFLGTRWDRKYGVDTSGQIDLVDIEVVGTNRDGGLSVVSTSPRAYTFLSAFFPANWREFTFVDVGCGKGRVLLLAALQGFDRVLGIEFAPLVSQIAEQNLARFSGRKPVKWSVVNADATAADLPSGVPLLIYCFNPFDAKVWREFILVLVKSRQVNKNPMCLVLSGTIPETLSGAVAAIESSLQFRERARGVTPFFIDSYSPYYYWVFDAI